MQILAHICLHIARSSTGQSQANKRFVPRPSPKMQTGWLLKVFTFLRNLSKQISFALFDKCFTCTCFDGLSYLIKDHTCTVTLAMLTKLHMTISACYTCHAAFLVKCRHDTILIKCLYTKQKCRNITAKLKCISNKSHTTVCMVKASFASLSCIFKTAIIITHYSNLAGIAVSICSMVYLKCCYAALLWQRQA